MILVLAQIFEFSSVTMPCVLSSDLTEPFLVHAEESPANEAGLTEQNNNDSSRCRKMLILQDATVVLSPSVACLRRKEHCIS